MATTTPQRTMYQFTDETISEADKLTPGIISEDGHKHGMRMGEPLIVAMDAMLKYAKAYRVRFDSNLKSDYVLGPDYLSAICGLRGLLNSDGAFTMQFGKSFDSKDNGCVEAVFWSAMEASGFTEEDID